MILIDSNIPMYLIGTSHPHKTDAQRILEKLISERQRLVTDAEVLQEIIHRYRALDRLQDIQRAFDSLLHVAEEVLPISLAIMEKAKQNVLAYRQLSARDAVHFAVTQQHGIDRILSFDSGFDGLPGVTRMF